MEFAVISPNMAGQIITTRRAAWRFCFTKKQKRSSYIAASGFTGEKGASMRLADNTSTEAGLAFAQ